MNLQFLEFDSSEDSEGVVCWDALSQPAAHHTLAMLQEVTELLAWAHRYATSAPGPLEDGADWDFDLQIHDGHASIEVHWNSVRQKLDLSKTPSASTEITLSLSLSGTRSFAGAFREHWNTP
jgi:hypothetical protein